MMGLTGLSSDLASCVAISTCIHFLSRELADGSNVQTSTQESGLSKFRGCVNELPKEDARAIPVVLK